MHKTGLNRCRNVVRKVIASGQLHSTAFVPLTTEHSNDGSAEGKTFRTPSVFLVENLLINESARVHESIAPEARIESTPLLPRIQRSQNVISTKKISKSSKKQSKETGDILHNWNKASLHKIWDKPPTLRHRELPTSPLMDEGIIILRNKHKCTKAPENNDLDQFRRQLRNNPYAQALITPLRMCQATKTMAPSYFLQDYTLMEHPETKEPWFAPQGLRAYNEGGFSRDQEVVGSSTIEHPAGSSVYVLARQPLIAGFGVKDSGYWSQWNQFARKINKRLTPSQYERIFWRPDMDELVLDLMRKRTVEGLIHLVSKKRGYTASCKDWPAAQLLKQPGALLWMGNLNDAGLGKRPGEFSIYDVGSVSGTKRQVPVHNLEILLGEKHLNVLRESHLIFRSAIISLRHRRMTLDTQLRLWKLQGYVSRLDGSNKEAPDA